MTIPLYEYPPAIDWIDLLDHIFEVYFIDLEDVSGRQSPTGHKRFEELKDQYKGDLEKVYSVFNQERPERDYRDRYLH